MESGRVSRDNTVPVSVIIPAYNRPELLEVTLQSVRAQTVAPREIIVVDDGSDDEAVGTVARDYGARVLRQDNAGLPAARNVGIAAATAPWVAFLDSDDLWLPRKLELQYGVLERTTGYGAVISNFRIFTTLGVFDESCFELNTAYRSIEKRAIAPDVYELSMTSAGHALTRSQFVLPSGLLVERDLAMRIGGFDPRMKRCEDHEFALRLFAATRVLAVDNAVVRYRVTPQSLSKNEVEMRLASLEVIERVLAAPERYPAGAEAVALAVKPDLIRKLAAAYIKSGDGTSARRALKPIVRDDPTPATLAMYVAALVAPRGLSGKGTQMALKLWRKRPGYRSRGWQAGSPASVAILAGADRAE